MILQWDCLRLIGTNHEEDKQRSSLQQNETVLSAIIGQWTNEHGCVILQRLKEQVLYFQFLDDCYNIILACIANENVLHFNLIRSSTEDGTNQQCILKETHPPFSSAQFLAPSLSLACNNKNSVETCRCCFVVLFCLCLFCLQRAANSWTQQLHFIP